MLEDDHNIKRALALADAMPSMPAPTASQPGDGISGPTPELLAVLGEEIVDFDLHIKASGASEQSAPVLTTPKPPTSWQRLPAQMALLTPTETLNAASLTLTGVFGAVIGPPMWCAHFPRNALPSGEYPANLKKHPPVGRMLFSTVP